MHLGVARLCLDCHEVHEYERCPACTSEAFAFITRWIKLDEPAPQPAPQRTIDPYESEKIDTYRQILQLESGGSRAGRWVRNGGLLVVAGVMARWGWLIANRTRSAPEESRERSETKS